MNSNKFKILLFSISLFFSGLTYATTIITGNTGPVETVPVNNIGNSYSLTANFAGTLLLDINSYIVIDSNVFSTINLTIDNAVKVYTSTLDFPDNVTIPDFQNTPELILSINLAFTNDFFGNIEFLYLKDISTIDLVDIKSSAGILVTNTNSVSAVPIPSAILLFINGAIALLFVAKKRNLSSNNNITSTT